MLQGLQGVPSSERGQGRCPLPLMQGEGPSSPVQRGRPTDTAQPRLSQHQLQPSATGL